MMTAYAALIETGSNQAYIFGTNKMRENVGASELVRRVGTVWVVEALQKLFGKVLDDFKPIMTTQEFTAWLREQGAKIVPEKFEFEVILATSGKAMVLFASQQKAKDFVWQVTSRALMEAPGLAVRGAVSDKPVDLSETKQDAADFNVALHHKLENLRNELPSSVARAKHWPIVEPCSVSGLPMAIHSEIRKSVISKSSNAKDSCRDIAYKRLDADKHNYGHLNFNGFDEKVEAAAIPWVAFVHADGNGFGNFFINLHKELPAAATARDYFTALRGVSLSLELCSLHAFLTASKSIFGEKVNSADIVPLVLGGDDMTIACDGTKAVSFTAKYLEEFEKACLEPKLFKQENEIIKYVTKDKPRLGAAAGIAIVKPHFPFHRAYELAEELLKSAKRAKTEAKTSAGGPTTFISSFDYQVVYGDGAIDLSNARAAWKHNDYNLTARPIVVTDDARRKLLEEVGKAWVATRLYAHSEIFSLQAARKALAAKSEDVKHLPRSQQKALRDALFESKDIAEARFEILRNRYCGKENSCDFYWPENLFSLDNTTLFLDAMDLIDIDDLGVKPPSADPTEDKK